MTRRCIPVVAALLIGACGKREQTPAVAGTILTARTLGLAYIEENRLPEAEEQFAKLMVEHGVGAAIREEGAVAAHRRALRHRLAERRQESL